MFLYTFFERLRTETAIPLDQRQYQHFLDCLVLRPPKDKASLLNLCKATWLSGKQFQTDFERLFNETFDPIEREWKAYFADLRPSSMQADEDVTRLPEPDKKNIKDRRPYNQDHPLEKKEHEEHEKDEVQPEEKSLPNNPEQPTEKEWEEVVLNIQEEERPGDTTTIPQEKLSAKKVGYVFSDAKHYPFNERKVRHAWRRLNGKYIAKKTQHLDIPTTISHYAKNGILSTVFFQYQKIPDQQVVWLSDHGGSMTPFEEWDNALFEAAKEQITESKISRYYFHCFPIMKKDNTTRKDFYFFTDRSQTKIQSLKELRSLWEKGTLLVIFSDGGAALERNENDRLETWYQLKEFAGKKVKLLWFNPVDAINENVDDVSTAQGSGWKNSSAAILSMMLPMHDLKNHSIRTAIQNL